MLCHSCVYHVLRSSTHGQGEVQSTFWLKMFTSVATNVAGNCREVSLKTSGRVILTKVEMLRPLIKNIQRFHSALQNRAWQPCRLFNTTKWSLQTFHHLKDSHWWISIVTHWKPWKQLEERCPCISICFCFDQHCLSVLSRTIVSV